MTGDAEKGRVGVALGCPDWEGWLEVVQDINCCTAQTKARGGYLLFVHNTGVREHAIKLIGKVVRNKNKCFLDNF